MKPQVSMFWVSYVIFWKNLAIMDAMHKSIRNENGKHVTLSSCPDESAPALTIMIALAIQRLPLPAKRNGALVARKGGD